MEGQQHPKLVDGIYRARRSQIIPAVAIAQTKTATFSAKRFFADSFLVVFLLALIISGFNFYFKTPKIKTQIPPRTQTRHQNPGYCVSSHWLESCKN